MLNSREKRDVIVAGFIAAMDGATFYVEDDSDPNVFHGRRDCPHLGDEVLVLTVRDGLLQDSKGFFYRDLLPCSRCISELCKENT